MIQFVAERMDGENGPLAVFFEKQHVVDLEAAARTGQMTVVGALISAEEGDFAERELTPGTDLGVDPDAIALSSPEANEFFARQSTQVQAAAEILKEERGWGVLNLVGIGYYPQEQQPDRILSSTKTFFEISRGDEPEILMVTRIDGETALGYGHGTREDHLDGEPDFTISKLAEQRFAAVTLDAERETLEVIEGALSKQLIDKMTEQAAA